MFCTRLEPNEISGFHSRAIFVNQFTVKHIEFFCVLMLVKFRARALVKTDCKTTMAPVIALGAKR